MTKDEYDGLYFLPGDTDEEMNLAYFRFKEEEDFGVPIESTEIGDKYHIAFFKKDELGDPVFDEEFEAIFADPTVYIKNLVGLNVYGCVLRKTEKSLDWWVDYLAKAKESCTLIKFKNALKRIKESKEVEQK